MEFLPKNEMDRCGVFERVFYSKSKDKAKSRIRDLLDQKYNPNEEGEKTGRLFGQSSGTDFFFKIRFSQFKI